MQKKILILGLAIFIFLSINTFVQADDGFNIFLMRFRAAIRNNDSKFLREHIDKNCDYQFMRFGKNSNPTFDEKIDYLIANKSQDILKTLNSGYAIKNDNHTTYYIFPKKHAEYLLGKASGKEAKIGEYLIYFQRAGGTWKMTTFAKYSL